jgi:hypothetical protein
MIYVAKVGTSKMTGLEKKDILHRCQFSPLDFLKTLHTFISLFKKIVILLLFT